MECSELLECSICMQLLLDPVVASCGHDFCRTCLLAWAETLPENKPIACPLCRSELAPCAEAVKAFGVCVRLKRMLENLYPEQVAQRRRERLLQEEARAKSHKTPAQQQLHFRQGRARYLRARRTRTAAAALGIDSAAAAAGTGASSSSAAAGSAASMTMRGAGAPAGVRQVRVDVAPSAVLAAGASMLPWAPHTDAHPSLVPVVAAGAGGSGSGTWQVDTSTVTFTMGWWEAPAKKGERRRRQQQRLSSLVQPARALGAGANALLVHPLPVAH